MTKFLSAALAACVTMVPLASAVPAQAQAMSTEQLGCVAAAIPAAQQAQLAERIMSENPGDINALIDPALTQCAERHGWDEERMITVAGYAMGTITGNHLRQKLVAGGIDPARLDPMLDRVYRELSDADKQSFTSGQPGETWQANVAAGLTAMGVDPDGPLAETIGGYAAARVIAQEAQAALRAD